MTYTRLTLTVLLASVLAAGCSSASAKTAGEREREDALAAKGENAKERTQEAAEATRDYAYAQKQEFVRNMKKDLAGMKTELDQLSAKVDRSTGDAKVDAKAKLVALGKEWAQANKELDRAEAANESTWNDVKGGFKRSYGDFQVSLKSTREWLSEKIAP